MSATRLGLDKFSKMQDSMATGDAWGVFLSGVPFSKLSGDHEGDVACLKGEVEAIETAQIKNRCAYGGRTLERQRRATAGDWRGGCRQGIRRDRHGIPGAAARRVAEGALKSPRRQH